ncbi:hypothetical protein AHF37_00843 [Paragonimus kellicotti]|nr:hypothetical protein AHF37_00843 [Paragonimus kellicotti]
MVQSGGVLWVLGCVRSRLKAAAYIRPVDTGGSVYSTLVFGKSRTALVRAVTVPRRELAAAIPAARLTNYVEGGVLWVLGCVRSRLKAAAYIRPVDTGGSVYSTLVFGKSRTALVRAVTVPRRELAAAIPAARLTNYVEGELLKDVRSAEYRTDITFFLRLIPENSSRCEPFFTEQL